MSCPTCSHTMHRLCDTLEDGRSFFWCPRCGTLKTVPSPTGHTSDDVPTLVYRCRKFGDTLGPAWGALWHTIGVAESIYPPSSRP